MYRPPETAAASSNLTDVFGVESAGDLLRDLWELLRDGLTRRRFQFGPTSLGLLRPDLSLPAYAGLVPEDGRAPISNLFDRRGGGRHYSQRVTRRRCVDYRGGRLTYDEHDGTDFVCPVGTPLQAAAPGTVVMIRRRWLRGGLTVAVDHGGHLVTHYTHCSEALVELGDRVARGEPVARSGAAGVDITGFFPWIPPHVHFMVWFDGRPVDPFYAPGDEPRPGRWRRRNDPVPSEGETSESIPPPSDISSSAVERAVASCEDDRIRAELEEVADKPACLGALLEDALHHDRWAWPEDFPSRPIRPRLTAADYLEADAVELTLPLPAEDYRGVRFADAPWTEPNG